MTTQPQPHEEAPQQQEQQMMDPRVRNFLERHLTVQEATKTTVMAMAGSGSTVKQDKIRAKFESIAVNRRTASACAKADDFWLDVDFQYRRLQSDLVLNQVENPSNAWYTWAPIRSLHTSMNSEQAQELFKASDFKILEQIGQGGYGSVYRAVHTPTNHIVALKQVDSASSPIETKEQRMLPLDCGVVPCYGTFRALETPPHDPSLDTTKLNLRTWMVLKYCSNGSLIDKVRKHSLSHKEAAHIIKRLSKILSYLHETHGIVHNDIKLANILLDDDGHSILLADLGVAQRGFEQTHRIGGTLSHMAPEKLADRKCINGKYYNHSKIDVFAMGVMLCEMLFWADPFEHKKAVEVPTFNVKATTCTDDEEEFAIKARNLLETLRTVYDSGMVPAKALQAEPTLKEFLQELLAFSPQDRMSMANVKKHPWIKSHGKWSDRMSLQLRTGLKLHHNKKKQNHVDKNNPVNSHKRVETTTASSSSRGNVALGGMERLLAVHS